MQCCIATGKKNPKNIELTLSEKIKSNFRFCMFFNLHVFNLILYVSVNACNIVTKVSETRLLKKKGKSYDRNRMRRVLCVCKERRMGGFVTGRWKETTKEKGQGSPGSEG